METISPDLGRFSVALNLFGIASKPDENASSPPVENTPPPAESSNAAEQPSAGEGSVAAKAGSASGKQRAPKLNPVRVMRTLGNPIRWGILEILSEGKSAAAIDLAKRLKADQDNVAKHLRVLELAGLIFARPALDARFRLYGIWPALQAGEQDGLRLYDLGFCVLRFPMPAESRETGKKETVPRREGA